MNLLDHNHPQLSNNGPVINNPSLGIGVLFAVFFGATGLLSVVIAILTKGQQMSTGFLRIATVIQDVVIFIVPALVAAIVATRLPASLLRLDVKPNMRLLAMAALVLITSVPAMNYIVSLNESISFPESMYEIEQALKQMEDSASAAIATLMGPHTVANLVMALLIVALLTGFSEELFFRGAFQGLLMSTRINRHLAVWIVAVVFSIFHFQAYGFVPRILLGAYFGYLVLWTGSIWIPILIHALNNAMALMSQWLSAGSDEGKDVVDAVTVASDHDFVLIGLSIVVTGLGLVILRRMCRKQIS